MTQDRFKFRGKRIDNGEWVYGGYVYPNAIEYIEEFLDEKTPSAWVMVSHEIDPKTVGQCTGLHDKNGVLIFEGDIVYKNAAGYFKPLIKKVEWDGLGWNLPRDENRSWGMGEPPTYQKFIYEIIGNVYEHPHLLKAGA